MFTSNDTANFVWHCFFRDFGLLGLIHEELVESIMSLNGKFQEMTKNIAILPNRPALKALLILSWIGFKVTARNVKTTIYTPKPLIVSTGIDIAHVLQHRNETRQTSVPLPRQYQFTGKQVICRSTRCLLQNDVTCVLFGNQAHSTAVHCTSSYLPSGYEFGQTRIHNCDNNNSSDTKPCFLEYTLIKAGPSYPGDENNHISSGILWSLFFLTFLMVGCFIYCWSYQLESFRCPPPLDYPGYPQFYAHYPRRPIYYVYAKRGRPNQKRSSAANKSTEDTDTKAMSIGSNND